MWTLFYVFMAVNTKPELLPLFVTRNKEMNTTKYLLLGMGLLACTGTVHAEDINMNPGMWTWTSQMEMPGMAFQMPATTYTECITRENMVPTNRNPTEECEVHDIKMTADNVSWRITCNTPAGVSTGQGRMNYSGNTARGDMQFTSQGMQMQMKLTGQRKGPCK
jgi:hypothetical protein